jgi:hypothetical protein
VTVKPVRVDATPLLRAIAIDHEDVFVTSYGPRLIAIDHANTARRELVPESGPACDLVVADPDGVYVTAAEAVWQVDKATGALTKLAALAGVSSLALDPRFVYATLRGSYPKYADGGVVRVSREGGTPEWLVQGRGAYALCVAGPRIYFASDGELWRRDADGESQALCPVRNPHAIVALGDTVAFGEFDQAGQPSMYTPGKPLRRLADQPYTAGMISIGDELYWGVSSKKKSMPAIWRMRLDAPEPAPVASFRAKAVRLVGNPQRLWWIDDVDGGLFMLPLA